MLLIHNGAKNSANRQVPTAFARALRLISHVRSRALTPPTATAGRRDGFRRSGFRPKHFTEAMHLQLIVRGELKFRAARAGEELAQRDVGGLPSPGSDLCFQASPRRRPNSSPAEFPAGIRRRKL